LLESMCVLNGARAIQKEPSSRLGSDQNTLRMIAPSLELEGTIGVVRGGYVRNVFAYGIEEI